MLVCQRSWGPIVLTERIQASLADSPPALKGECRRPGPWTGAAAFGGGREAPRDDPLCPPGTRTPTLLSPCLPSPGPRGGQGQGTPLPQKMGTAPSSAGQLRALGTGAGRQERREGGKDGGGREEGGTGGAETSASMGRSPPRPPAPLSHETHGRQSRGSATTSSRDRTGRTPSFPGDHASLSCLSSVTLT